MIKFAFYLLTIWSALVTTGFAEPIKVTSKPLNYAQELTFHSELLGKTTSMNLYLPASFEQASDEHRYPVIFADGSHGREFFLTLSGVVKHLGELDRIPESIVISLNDNAYIPETYTNGMWGSREKIDAWGDPEVYVKHLTEELFPYLQAHYRAADYNMIIGVSGSALFALYSLTHHPELFDYHIFTTSHDMIGMGFQQELDIISHIKKRFTQPGDSQTAFYFAVADDDLDRNNPARDTKYQKNMQRLTKTLNEIPAQRLFSKVEVIAHERHYDVYIKALLSAFEFRFPESRWAKKYRELIAQPGDALENIENHYRHLSEEYGFTVLPKGDRWNSVNCLRLISRVLFQDERFDESVSVTKRWAELRPYSAQPYQRLAQIYEAQDQRPLAVKALDRGLLLAPKHEVWLVEQLERQKRAMLQKNAD